MYRAVAVSSDPLFLGMTRPAMVGGVTYTYCAINGMVSCLAFLGSGHLALFLVAIPIHVLGFALCLKDPRQIDVLLAHLLIKARCRNAHFWRATSYAELS